jgi:NCAIR mutase (PurE)-related protein
VKLRAKIVKWNGAGMVAVCKACNSDVPVTAEILKSIQSTFVFEVQKSSCGVAGTL